MLSNIYSKAAGHMEAEFHMESLWVGGIKVCSYGVGHVTEMATMHILVKTL